MIYAWTGGSYSDVSNHYKKYYEDRLASLHKEIATTEQNNDQTEPVAAATAGGVPAGNIAEQIGRQAAANSNKRFSGGVGLLATPSPLMPLTPLATNDQGLNCDKAEASKIERFLSNSSDAGMSDAVKWAASDSSAERLFAASVLADIGTPQAVEDLRTLSGDAESSVASSAKNGLARIVAPPTHFTIQREVITPDTDTLSTK